MNTSFSLANQDFQLFRYPPKSQHPTLQAWGAEDEYVLTHILENSAPLGRLLVLNDEFGAMGCALNHHVIEEAMWQSDSYIAHCAFKDNLSRNNLHNRFTLVDSMTSLDGVFDTVLIRLPKNLQYLEHQLRMLSQHVTKQTHIIATGKVKTITKPVLSMFESILGETKTSLAVKKARLIFCTPSSERKTEYQTQTTRWSLPLPRSSLTMTLHNYANVFSSRSLDIGARFMLENLMPFNDESVLDLGCGNGVLGLAVLANSSNCNVSFVDESYMAVASAHHNVECNLPDKSENATFIVDNCLDKHRKGEIKHNYDRILCNPPFHQQNSITDHIAWQMFNDAKACLKKGGKLWVVSNRHLGYHDKLKRVFGGVRTLASNPKFVILETIKR